MFGANGEETGSNGLSYGGERRRDVRGDSACLFASPMKLQPLLRLHFAQARRERFLCESAGNLRYRSISSTSLEY